MENRYKITYDLKQRVITNIRFKQGDVDSSVLEVSLVDNSLAVDITGETIEFRFLKPDNTIVFQDSTTGVTILDGPDGKVECVLKSNTLASAGVVKCEIHRSKDGKELTTPSFYFTVESSIGENGILSTNYIKLIDDKVTGWQADIDALKKAYDDSTKANTSTEVTAARHDNVNNKDYANLGARLDFHDSSLNDITNLIKSSNILNPSDMQWYALLNSSGLIASNSSGKTGVFTFKPKLNTRYYFTRKTSAGAYTYWDSRTAFCDVNGNVLYVISSGAGAYDITITDPNIVYIRKYCPLFNNNDAITAPINGGMIIEGWDGTTPASFIPYSVKLNFQTPTVLPIKISDLLDDIGVQLFDWFAKDQSTYGDSISAINNGYSGDILGSANNNMWGAYVHNYFKMSAFLGRGIGSSTFCYSTQTWYANSDGSYNSRPGDGVTQSQPAGTTVHKGYFSSWDRIKTMYSDSIRNNIDLILVMGGTNDFGVNNPLGSNPVWSTSNTTDTDWSADATFYNGGDYDITNFKGAVASTVMKLQARCPNAIIVLMTQMSGEGGVIHNPQSNTLNLNPVDYAKALIDTAQFMSIPCIDVFGNTGVNNLNATTSVLSDGVHPNTIAGAKALGRAVIGGLKGILPNL